MNKKEKKKGLSALDVARLDEHLSEMYELGYSIDPKSVGANDVANLLALLAAAFDTAWLHAKKGGRVPNGNGSPAGQLLSAAYFVREMASRMPDGGSERKSASSLARRWKKEYEECFSKTVKELRDGLDKVVPGYSSMRGFKRPGRVVGINAREGKTLLRGLIPMVYVGGSSWEDCIDSVKEYVGDHAEELFSAERG